MSMSNEEMVEQATNEGNALAEIVNTEEHISTDKIQTENHNHKSTLEYQADQKTRSGSIISPVGDHSHITVYNIYGIKSYRKLIDDVEKDFENEKYHDDVQKDKEETIEDLIKANLLFERQNIPQFDDIHSWMEARTKNPPEDEDKLSEQNIPQFDDIHSWMEARTKNPPEDEDKPSDWYYKLNKYEQCYVQVVATLHGALAQEIYKQTDALYKTVQRQNTVKQAVSSQEQLAELTAKQVQTFMFPQQPRLELQHHTYTTTARVKGAEHLFWKDADENGQSLFGTRLLTFLAKELISKEEYWQSFFKLIQEWSKLKGDCSWRAARALGIILWHHDVYQLRKQANEWAKANTYIGRRLAASLLDGAREAERIKQGKHQDSTQSSAASLLDGAREAERIKQGKHQDSTQSSAVFQLLNEWIEKVCQDPNKTNISIGCATANTYGLIGKISADIVYALKGTKHLLSCIQSKNANNSILAAGVSTYISLTWAGHIRDVMKDFANTAEELVHRRELPSKLKQRSHYRLQRETQLKALFEAFFLVAAAASSKESGQYADIYALPLAESPQLLPVPDERGRDLMLLAILVKDPMLCDILVLLCSNIVVANNKLTFELIRQWADIVVGFQQSPTPISQQLYHIFIQFLVELGGKINIWCYDFKQQGYRMPGARETYYHKLELWHKEGVAHKHPIGKLAREVLFQLDTGQTQKKKQQ